MKEAEVAQVFEADDPDPRTRVIDCPEVLGLGGPTSVIARSVEDTARRHDVAEASLRPGPGLFRKVSAASAGDNRLTQLPKQRRHGGQGCARSLASNVQSFELRGDLFLIR